MKINQLFNKNVEQNVLQDVLTCFGLKSLDDRHMFKRQDLINHQTVQKLNLMKTLLASYYLPCKAKMYLENINEKKAVTLLRQIVRLFDHHIVSKEKNILNKKVIFYMLQSNAALEETACLKTRESHVTIDFN